MKSTWSFNHLTNHGVVENGYMKLFRHMSVFCPSSRDSVSSVSSENSSNHSITHHLSILYTNCLSPVIDDLRLLAAAQTPDIISLCETWLDDSIASDELAIDCYSLIRRDRNRHGGGIAIYT